MKGFRAAVAVASLAFGWLAGCNDYNNSIQYNTGATVTNISPTGLPAGNAAFLLTVNASSFNAFATNTVIQWNGKKLATTYRGHRHADGNGSRKPAGKSGSCLRQHVHAAIGLGKNGLSNTLGFKIYGAPNPLPTLTTVSPTSAPACGTSCANASVTITVDGTNFLPASNNGGTAVTLSDLTSQQPTALTISSYFAFGNQGGDSRHVPC